MSERFQEGDPLEKASKRLAELTAGKDEMHKLVQDVVIRAGALDERRQEQIRLQRESIDRMAAKLNSVHRIIYDDESWAGTGAHVVRHELLAALENE